MVVVAGQTGTSMADLYSYYSHATFLYPLVPPPSNTALLLLLLLLLFIFVFILFFIIYFYHSARNSQAGRFTWRAYTCFVCENGTKIEYICCVVFGTEREHTHKKSPGAKGYPFKQMKSARSILHGALVVINAQKHSTIWPGMCRHRLKYYNKPKNHIPYKYDIFFGKIDVVKVEGECYYFTILRNIVIHFEFCKTAVQNKKSTRKMMA